ncbi:hypothetical protein [Paraburkholderia sp. J8-2]|uniref:hypothetical protein n=1 Tax=Paraburkholderia sp. J8-2 TaxID=2805440 RepID=UPI002AB75DD7|nr:hypothetical protein [Paraburkholderia sp. J8-2]
MKEAWSKTVEKYDSGFVNSERAVQAILWSELQASFSERFPKVRVFVEPLIVLGKGTDERRKVRPDFAICSATKIIGVVELKYSPRGKAAMLDDVKKLATISAAGSSISVSHERYRGKALACQTYSMATSPLFVWAGFHTGVLQNEISEDVMSKLRGGFFEMHAHTRDRQTPQIEFRVDR